MDLGLALKHIRLVPSLPLEISRIVYDGVKSLKSKGQLLPLIENGCEDGCIFSTEFDRKHVSSRVNITDAAAVAKIFAKVSHYYCECVASTIALYPHCETWLPILSFVEGLDLGPSRFPTMVDNFVLQIQRDPGSPELDIANSVWSCLTEELRGDIRKISDRFKSIAAFQFHVPNSKVEELFIEMGEKAKRKKFAWPRCSTLGYEQSDILAPRPPDSISTIKLLPSIGVVCPTFEIRRSARLNGQKSASGSRAAAKGRAGRKGVDIWPTVIIKPNTPMKLDSNLFIQQVLPFLLLLV